MSALVKQFIEYLPVTVIPPPGGDTAGFTAYDERRFSLTYLDRTLSIQYEARRFPLDQDTRRFPIRLTAQGLPVQIVEKKLK